MNTGFIKLHRKLTDWEWYDDANTFRLFMHILLTANHKATKYRGTEIAVGAMVSGHDALATRLSLSVQQVRTSIKKLKSTNVITVKTTNKFSVISLINWELYQSREKIEQTKQQTNNKQVTNEQQTSNKQVTPSKEGKKVRSKEDIKNKQKNISKIDYSCFPSLPNKKLLEDWLKVRKTKRLTNTQTAMDGIGKELHKATASGYTVDECFTTMCVKGWGGFEAVWMDNLATKKNNQPMVESGQSAAQIAIARRRQKVTGASA